MTALTCDICGGSLAMDASGDFAVCESCGMKHTKERVKAKARGITGTVEVSNIASLESLMKRGYLSLEDEKWRDAVGYFDKAHDINPEYAPAYAGKLCAEMSSYSYFSDTEYTKTKMEDCFAQVKDDFFLSKFKKEADLARCYKPLDSLPDKLKAIYEKAIRFADDAYRAQLEGYNSEIKKRIEELKKKYAFYMVIEKNNYQAIKNEWDTKIIDGYNILSGTCLVENPGDPLYIKVFTTGAEYEIDKTGDGYKVKETKKTDMSSSLPGYVSISTGDVIVTTDEILRKKEQELIDKQRLEAKQHFEKLERERKELERIKEQQEKWASEGLCRHCGGKLSLFGKKCKSCGREN